MDIRHPGHVSNSPMEHRMTKISDIAVTNPSATMSTMSTETVSAAGHDAADTTTVTDGHELPGWPGHDAADTATGRTGDTTDPNRLADYFVECQEPAGNSAAVTWTTIITGSVELPAPGAEALEDFVDQMARTVSASRTDDRTRRVSAMIPATGYAAYTEVGPRRERRRGRRFGEVGRGVDTDGKRRRIRRRGL